MEYHLTESEKRQLRDMVVRFGNKEPGLYRRMIGDRIAVVRVAAVPAMLKPAVDQLLESMELTEAYGDVQIYIDKEKFHGTN